MKITILTLFPQMFVGPFGSSILKIAQEKNLLHIEVVDIRNFGIGPHKTVDDTPYGGGIGMVMRVDVLDKAIQSVKQENGKQKVVLLSAHGKVFNQTKAKDIAEVKHLILVCGHYEGIDERVKTLVDEEISIGNFITTGGEIPAMLIVDAVARLIPGVLKPGVTDNESYSLTIDEKPALEYPQYTRPAEYNGMIVPDILVSGNHKQIEEWRHEQAKKITQQKRPDLLE